MKLVVLELLLVVVLASTVSADIGEFFDNLFSAFKPEEAKTVDLSTNATTQQNSTELGTSTVQIANQTDTLNSTNKTSTPTPEISGYVNLTTTTSARLEENSIAKSQAEVTPETGETTPEEVTTNLDTTIENGTLSPTPSTTTIAAEVNTTTVVYKLFHPNTTTTTELTTAVTVEATHSTENATNATTSTTERAEFSNNGTGVTLSSGTKRDVSLEIDEAPLHIVNISSSTENSSHLAPPLASYRLANGVSCSVTVPAGTSTVIISCNDSTFNASSTNPSNSTESASPSSTPVEHKIKKRDTSSNESYPPSSAVSDDDGDVPLFWDSGESVENGYFTDGGDAVPDTTIITSQQ
ncbi:uncharacterized protein LOC131687060 [Topomyia yanbarensis]|uniref:uncharacterized protein LOC131687060 n=1 Tax=Topomyia yanbarensis TaxID=2498891 RepID=UPI00273AB18D|nr:uncharacterized protein LOC131687060 [Topomyia yanbarensis]